MVNHCLGASWKAASAGIRPSGHVHPLTVRAMAELGIDISSHWSKHTDEFCDVHFDLVVTACDSAAKNCPAWLGTGQAARTVVHIGFPDPAAATGSEAEQLQVFRQIRHAIRQEILNYLEQSLADKDIGQDNSSGLEAHLATGGL